MCLVRAEFWVHFFTSCIASFYSKHLSTSTAISGKSGIAMYHGIHTTGSSIFGRLHKGEIGPRFEAAKKQLCNLPEQDIIRPLFNQPTWRLNLISKSNDTRRITCNYRCLNACTNPDHYLLSIIEHLMQELLSTFAKVFCQILITKKYTPKTAIIFVPFHFTWSSICLRNVTQSLQRTIDHPLRDCLPTRCCYYSWLETTIMNTSGICDSLFPPCLSRNYASTGTNASWTGTKRSTSAKSFLQKVSDLFTQGPSYWGFS